MSTAILPLQDLARTINQQEAELARLREEFETRQAQLNELLALRQHLHTQLENVETEIQAIGFHAPSTSAQPSKSTAGKPATSPIGASAKPSDKVPSLPKLLLQIVSQALQPMTSKDLTEAVIRCKYPTKSDNLQAIVETRVGDLVRKGHLKRSKDQIGVVLAAGAKGMTATANGHAKTTAAKPSGARKKSSLKDVLTQLLSKSARPLNTEELAKKVLATGYKTKSKDFKNVIWVSVGTMKNVERVPKQGYRLKTV